MKNNRAIKIAAAGVSVSEAKETVARSDYYPHLTASFTYSGALTKHLVTIPTGEFGSVAGIPLPPSDYNVNRDGNIAMLNAIIAQPLTQLLKINENVKAAEADTAISQAELEKAKDEVTLAVKSIYFGMMIADSRIKAYQTAVDAAQESLKDANADVISGNSLEIKNIEAQANLLKNQQYLMQAQISYEDLNADLNILTGTKEGTIIAVDESAPEEKTMTESEYLALAENGSQELEAARETLEKAKHGKNASVYEYIPDVSLFAAHAYLDNVPYINDNITTVGIKLDWDILDWGKKRGVRYERTAEMAQASQNLLRVKEQLRADIGKAYRRITRTQQMRDTAQKAFELYQEKYRISSNMRKAGLISDSALKADEAAMKNAEADLKSARLDRELAVAQMNRLISK